MFSFLYCYPETGMLFDIICIGISTSRYMDLILR